MATQSIAAKLRNRIRDFGVARNGNAAIIFALASVPIIAMMGVAVDYGHANQVRADLQAALDSTALMVSKSAPTMTATELQNAATTYFNALFKNPASNSATVTASYDASKSTVTLNGTSKMKTDFVKVMAPKYAELPITGSSSVSWGNSRLRVALALDNTGSMASNNKMTALKTAAKNLLTQLQSAALNNGDVYVSIIPFAKDVNVGPGNYNATWVDYKDHPSYDGWDDKNGTCSKNFDWNEAHNKANCLNHNNAKWTPDNHNTWNGCVTDRDIPYDITATTPDVTKSETLFPAEEFGDCPVALMPLSYDWTALKNKIDSMQPDGNTNVTIGLVWGWQTLTSGVPFPAPAEQSGYKYQKVLILLTDGDNTQNRFSTSQSAIDARTKLACDNAKAAGITIYTVLVMEGSQSLLQACATDANKYFYLQSASALVTAFNQIGTDLTNLRVSK